LVCDAYSGEVKCYFFFSQLGILTLPYKKYVTPRVKTSDFWCKVTNVDKNLFLIIQATFRCGCRRFPTAKSSSVLLISSFHFDETLNAARGRLI